MEAWLNILVRNAIEATVLAAAIALALAFIRATPAVRHALWVLVLVKLLAPPIAIQPVGLSALARWATGRFLESGAAPAAEVAAPAEEPVPAQPVVLAEDLLVSLETLPAEDGPQATGEGAIRMVESEPPTPVGARIGLAEAMLGVWVAGAALVAGVHVARTVAFRIRLGRWRRADSRLEAACASVAAQVGLRRAPRVRVASRRVPPFLWVLGPATVVIPEGLAGDPDGPLVRSILAHELAHLRRRDHWVSWLELLVTCVYWWLPTPWLVLREIRTAADLCADGRAVRGLGSRRSYAESLLDTLDFLCAEDGALPGIAPGRALLRRERLERRLTMILKQPLDRGLTLRSWLLVAVVAGLVLPAAPALRGQAPPQPEGLPGASPAEPASTPAPVPPVPPIPPAPTLPPALPGVPAPPMAVPPGGPSVEDRLSALEATMGQVLAELRALRRGGNRAPAMERRPMAAPDESPTRPGLPEEARPAVRSPRVVRTGVVPGPVPASNPPSPLGPQPRAMTPRQQAAIQALEAKHREEVAQLERSFLKAYTRILSEAEVPEDPMVPGTAGSTAPEPVPTRR